MSSESEANANYICIGVITGAHGMGGAVKVKSHTANPADIASYGEITDASGQRQFSLRIQRSTGKALVAKIGGVDDRNGAEALKGTELYIPRDALPELEEDEFYYSDLTGLDVELMDGSRFGVVRLVDNYGAGDVIEIEMMNGKTAFYPFNKAVIPVVDLENHRVQLDPPTEVSERDPDEQEPVEQAIAEQNDG